MARDRVEWMGCDAPGCEAEISGPAGRLPRQAQAAGWVRKLQETWRDEDDAGEVWADLCPGCAAAAYLRWAGEYAGRYGVEPWDAALADAAARVRADAAAAPSGREGRYWWTQEAAPGDAGPLTALAGAALLLSGWLLLPGVAEIGPEAAAGRLMWSSPEQVALPGPALGKIGAAERDALERVRSAGEGDWRRWGECLARILLDDRT